jgi:hypothetical protein
VRLRRWRRFDVYVGFFFLFLFFFFSSSHLTSSIVIHALFLLFFSPPFPLQFRIAGLPNNVAFLERLASHPSFAGPTPELHAHFIDEHRAMLVPEHSAGINIDLLAVATCAEIVAEGERIAKAANGTVTHSCRRFFKKKNSFFSWHIFSVN